MCVLGAALSWFCYCFRDPACFDIEGGADGTLSPNSLSHTGFYSTTSPFSGLVSRPSVAARANCYITSLKVSLRQLSRPNIASTVDRSSIDSPSVVLGSQFVTTLPRPSDEILDLFPAWYSPKASGFCFEVDFRQEHPELPRMRCTTNRNEPSLFGYTFDESRDVHDLPLNLSLRLPRLTCSSVRASLR
jgi:hypothetical protein